MVSSSASINDIINGNYITLDDESSSNDRNNDSENRISKLIHDHLQKGYTMLTEACPDCETVLLQNSDNGNISKICVSCDFLNEDASHKDNDRGTSGLNHHQSSASNAIGSSSSHGVQLIVDRKQMEEEAYERVQQILNQCTPAATYSSSKQVLLQKINWCTGQLKSNTDVNLSIQLCTLMKLCAETLQSFDRIGGSIVNTEHQLPSLVIHRTPPPPVPASSTTTALVINGNGNNNNSSASSQRSSTSPTNPHHQTKAAKCLVVNSSSASLTENNHCNSSNGTS